MQLSPLIAVFIQVSTGRPSYITTAARHGQNMLDVLIQAAGGHPWIPAT